MQNSRKARLLSAARGASKHLQDVRKYLSTITGSGSEAVREEMLEIVQQASEVLESLEKDSDARFVHEGKMLLLISKLEESE